MFDGITNLWIKKINLPKNYSCELFKTLLVDSIDNMTQKYVLLVFGEGVEPPTKSVPKNIKTQSAKRGMTSTEEVDKLWKENPGTWCFVNLRTMQTVPLLVGAGASTNQLPKDSKFPFHQKELVSSCKLTAKLPSQAGDEWVLMADCQKLGAWKGYNMDIALVTWEQANALTKMSSDKFRKCFTCTTPDKSWCGWVMTEGLGQVFNEYYDPLNMIHETPEQIIANGVELYPDLMKGIKVMPEEGKIAFNLNGASKMKTLYGVQPSNGGVQAATTTRRGTPLLGDGTVWMTEVIVTIDAGENTVFVDETCAICMEKVDSDFCVLMHLNNDDLHTLCPNCTPKLVTGPEAKCPYCRDNVTCWIKPNLTESTPADDANGQEPGNDGQEPEPNEAQTISPPQPAQEAKDELQPQRTSAVVDLLTSDDQSKEEEDWPGLKEAIAASLAMCGEKRAVKSARVR